MTSWSAVGKGRRELKLKLLLMFVVCVAAGVPATAAGGLEATAATAGHAEHTGNHRASHRPRSTCASGALLPQLPPFVFPFSSCLSSLMTCLGSEVVEWQAFFHNMLKWSIVEVEMMLPQARIQTCQGFPLLFLEVVRVQLWMLYLLPGSPLF